MTFHTKVWCSREKLYQKDRPNPHPHDFLSISPLRYYFEKRFLEKQNPRKPPPPSCVRAPEEAHKLIWDLRKHWAPTTIEETETRRATFSGMLL